MRWDPQLVARPSHILPATWTLCFRETTPKFSLFVPAQIEDDAARLSIYDRSHVLDLLTVFSIERVSYAKDCGEAANLSSSFLGEFTKINMCIVRRTFAMVARNIRDDCSLFWVYAHDVGVKNDVIAVLVVTTIVQEISYIVQHGSTAQE
jgi:hypothetical protein